MSCLQNDCVSLCMFLDLQPNKLGTKARGEYVGLMELNHAKPHQRKPKEACACPTPGELRVVQPPIHPRVRPTDNYGKFFVICLQPVTFPHVLYTQVTQVSVRQTMTTVDSGSARGRHWQSWALGPPCTVQKHSPHSGDRKAQPFPGRAHEGLHLVAGFAPVSRCF